MIMGRTFSTPGLETDQRRGDTKMLVYGICSLAKSIQQKRSILEGVGKAGDQLKGARRRASKKLPTLLNTMTAVPDAEP